MKDVHGVVVKTIPLVVLVTSRLVVEVVLEDGHLAHVFWQKVLTKSCIPMFRQMLRSVPQFVTASTHPPSSQNPQKDGQSEAMIVLQAGELH